MKTLPQFFHAKNMTPMTALALMWRSCILWRVNNLRRFVFCIAIFLFLLHDVIGVSACNAQIDVNAIAKIESSLNPAAVSFLGEKYGRGLHQISEVALKDFNSFSKVKYSPNQLFNPAVNTEIANWLLSKRYPQILKAYRLPLTEENLLTCFNMGCASIKKGKTATNYIKKYRRALNHV